MATAASIPTPLSVKPSPKLQRYYLVGPLGREVARCWSPLEAEVLASRVNAYEPLVSALKALSPGLHCMADVLNPCWDNRPTDVLGKHWGGGLACAACNARGLLASLGEK